MNTNTVFLAIELEFDIVFRNCYDILFSSFFIYLLVISFYNY
jgi:hypothetical protein